MEFKLFGTRFSISFGFFAVVAWYVLYGYSGGGLAVLTAVALHECGHLLMMWLAGVKIPAVEFCPFGIRLERQTLLPVAKETAVYLGGVLANAVCLCCWVPWYGWDAFSQAHLGLLLFNLLPVGRLDGGQLLRLALFRLDPVTAQQIQWLVGFLGLAPLFAAGFWMLWRGNVSLLLTVVYLAATMGQ
ncbi:MAG: hypothetical protein HFG20_03150 [Anaerotruncus sp.]|nr:hypothetical protein [Anaerotruncus sp.]